MKISGKAFWGKEISCFKSGTMIFVDKTQIFYTPTVRVKSARNVPLCK